MFRFPLNLLVSPPRNQRTSFYMLGMLLDMLALQQFSFIQDSNLSPVLLRFLVRDKEKTMTKSNLDSEMLEVTVSIMRGSQGGNLEAR